MSSFPSTLLEKLNSRKLQKSLRELTFKPELDDFSSNDYLGIASSEKIYHPALHILKEGKALRNGATGSRLLLGYHELFDWAESGISHFCCLLLEL